MNTTKPITRFSDLGISATSQEMVGDKIRLDKILNKEVIVCAYTITPSKYTEKGNGKLLTLQLKVAGEFRVLFTGSKTLQELVEKTPKDKFPFIASIVKDGDRLLFS